MDKGIYIKQADGSYTKFMHFIENEVEYSQITKAHIDQKKITLAFYFFNGIDNKEKNILNLTFSIKQNKTILLYGTVIEKNKIRLDVKYGDGQLIKSKKVKV